MIQTAALSFYSQFPQPHIAIVYLVLSVSGVLPARSAISLVLHTLFAYVLIAIVFMKILLFNVLIILVNFIVMEFIYATYILPLFYRRRIICNIKFTRVHNKCMSSVAQLVDVFRKWDDTDSNPVLR